jgi:hypothetical protein
MLVELAAVFLAGNLGDCPTVRFGFHGVSLVFKLSQNFVISQRKSAKFHHFPTAIKTKNF